MRIVLLPAYAALLFCSPRLIAEPALTAPNVAVGNQLETAAAIALSEPAAGDFDITLRSADGKRLRLSAACDQAGVESLTLRLPRGSHSSPPFWIQASVGSGSVAYTATAPGFRAVTGEVTLTPSAILVRRANRAERVVLTTSAPPAALIILTARLDAWLRPVETQAVAGGSIVHVVVISSVAAAGAISPPTVDIGAGTDSATVQFAPGGEAETVISANVPDGFSAPAERGKVTAVVQRPGLGISDHLVIGRNLEVAGVLTLGAPAPNSGAEISLTSSDESRLLLSAAPDGVGSKTLRLAIPPGGIAVRYYLQALASFGTVSYSAGAPGYRTRQASVSLAPSGIVLTPDYQGPPDEAQVLLPNPREGTYRLLAAVSASAQRVVTAWTVQLDAVTHKSADITVQPLRGGLSLTVSLENSNPDVGTVGSAIVFQGGADSATTEFTPHLAGSTKISVTTPRDFTPSANSTTVIAIVRD